MSHYHDNDVNYCNVCGNRVVRGYRFCTRCGAQTFSAPAYQPGRAHFHSPVCPRCGAKRREGALFCKNCGRHFGEGRERPESEYCPVCGTPKSEGAAFCTKCGEHFASEESHCPICGELVRPGAKYCMRCGTSFGQTEPAYSQVPEACPNCGLPKRTFSETCPRCHAPYAAKGEYRETDEPIPPPVLRLVERICLNCGKGVSDPEAKFCVSCGAPLDSAPIPDANAPARGLNNMLAQIDGEVSQALSDLSQSIGGAAGSAPSLSFGSERVEIPQAGSLEPIANADIASGTNEMTVENPVKYQDIYSPEEEEPKGAEEGAPDASAPGAQIEAALGDAPGAIIYMPTMSTAIGDGIASAGEDNGIILTWPQKAEAAIITEDAEPRPLHGSAPAAPRIFDGPQAPWTDITPTARRAAPPEPAAAPAAGDAGGEWFDILSLKTPDGQTLSDTVQESSQSRVEPVTEWFDECGPEEPEPPSAEGEGESLPAPAPRLSMDAKQSSRITPILSLDDSVPDHMETLEDWDSGEVDEAVADVAELDFAESGEDSLGDDAFFPTDSIASLAALDSPEKASEAPEYEMSSKDDEIVARLEDVEQEACPSCNAKRKKGAKFCTKCGYRFV